MEKSIALSGRQKTVRSQRVDTVNFTEGKPVKGGIAGIDFPVLLLCQIFKNNDGRRDYIYGASEKDRYIDRKAL